MFENFANMNNINENKYFIGLMMILVNIGSRFIIGELSDTQKKLINDKNLRRIFIFGVFFMATRDIVSSLILTIMFVLLVSELFNEESEISLLPKEDKVEDNKKDTKADNDKKMQDSIDVLYDVKNNL